MHPPLATPVPPTFGPDAGADLEQLRLLFDTLNEGIALNEAILDADGQMVDYRILWVNQAFYSTADYLRDQPVLGNTATSVYGMTPELIRAFWLGHRDRTTTAHVDMWSPLRNRCFRIATSPFLNRRFVTSFIDVTEDRHAARLAERAERLEALGVLAGGVAHDFNNYLGGIFGTLERLRDHVTDPEAQAELALALSTLDRARRLSARLVTFARGGAPVRTCAEIGPFVADTIRFALTGSSCACSFDIAADVWPAHYDPTQIAQVLENLVINARQAMPNGGILQVRAGNRTIPPGGHPTLPPGPYVEIAVADQGPGIPLELQSRVFDPFYTTKRNGHGLGLASAHSILRRHEGSLELESTPGAGATFRFLLPADPGARVTSVRPTVHVHRGEGTFLVMDDELVLRMTVAAGLVAAGYRVLESSDGQETVRQLRGLIEGGEPVAGILLDLTVPGGMGGMEALAEIRQVDPHVPVFVTTGYAADPVLSDPTRYGFTGGIAKPFRREELHALLDRHLG